MSLTRMSANRDFALFCPGRALPFIKPAPMLLDCRMLFRWRQLTQAMNSLSHLYAVPSNPANRGIYDITILSLCFLRGLSKNFFAFKTECSALTSFFLPRFVTLTILWEHSWTYHFLGMKYSDFLKNAFALLIRAGT
jgi:hypothetical protein